MTSIGSAPRLLYWCHTTARQPFVTGVQRVTRRLAGALSTCGITVVPVGLNTTRRLPEAIGATANGCEAFEALTTPSGSPPCLFVPEVTADLVADGTDPIQIGRAYGLRTAAIVHDLIPVKLAAHYPPDIVAMFERYYASLACADLVLTTTQLVAQDFRAYLDRRGLVAPRVEVVPLPAQFGDHRRVVDAAPARETGTPLRLVTVSAWEPRKNLIGLLQALTKARRHAPIALTLVGKRGLFPDYDRQVEATLATCELATSEAVTVVGTVPDEALADLFARSDASVYPSWEEGFGMPVLESLWLGRPCLHHAGSSMAEIGRGGGTAAVDMTDEATVADALVMFATDHPRMRGLAEEAVRRPLASWADYGAAIAGFLGLA